MQQQPLPLDSSGNSEGHSVLLPLVIDLVVHIGLLEAERLIDLRKLKCGRLAGIAEERAKAGGSVFASGQEIHLVSQLKMGCLQMLGQFPAAVQVFLTMTPGPVNF